MLTTENAVAQRSGVNYRAVAAAAVATLVASSIYYLIFGNVWASLRGLDPGAGHPTPQAWEIIGQFLRNAVEITLLAVLLRWVRATSNGAALRLGVLVWLGFQAGATAGAVLHEQYPFGLYLLHAGDALMTTMIAVLILRRWGRVA